MGQCIYCMYGTIVVQDTVITGSSSIVYVQIITNNSNFTELFI